MKTLEKLSDHWNSFPIALRVIFYLIDASTIVIGMTFYLRQGYFGGLIVSGIGVVMLLFRFGLALIRRSVVMDHNRTGSDGTPHSGG